MLYGTNMWELVYAHTHAHAHAYMHGGQNNQWPGMNVNRWILVSMNTFVIVAISNCIFCNQQVYFVPSSLNGPRVIYTARWWHNSHVRCAVATHWWSTPDMDWGILGDHHRQVTISIAPHLKSYCLWIYLLIYVYVCDDISECSVHIITLWLNNFKWKLLRHEIYIAYSEIQSSYKTYDLCAIICMNAALTFTNFVRHVATIVFSIVSPGTLDALPIAARKFIWRRNYVVTLFISMNFIKDTYIIQASA